MAGVGVSTTVVAGDLLDIKSVELGQASTSKMLLYDGNPS